MTDLNNPHFQGSIDDMKAEAETMIAAAKVEGDQIKRKGAEQVELQFFLNPNSEKSRSKPYALCTDVHSMLLFRKLSNL